MGMEGRVFRAEGTVCVKAEARCTFWESSTANPGRLAATIMWGTLGFLTQASYPIEPQVHCHTFIIKELKISFVTLLPHPVSLDNLFMIL